MAQWRDLFDLMRKKHENFFRAGGIRVQRLKISKKPWRAVVLTTTALDTEVHLVTEDHDPGDEDDPA